jgi:hypothetical protein
MRIVNVCNKIYKNSANILTATADQGKRIKCSCDCPASNGGFQDKQKEGAEGYGA